MLFCGLIPNHVLSNKKITQTAKLVYGIIYGFNFNGRKCTANNGTIAEAVGVEEQAISRAISSLEALKLITRAWEDGQRVLSVTSLTNSLVEDDGVVENDMGGSQKRQEKVVENDYHNNNIIYNINIKKNKGNFLVSKDTEFTAKHFLPLTEETAVDVRYMNVGRRPLKKYPKIWITPTELENILARCKECTVNPHNLFDHVQSFLLQKLQEGQDEKRINVASALSGWAFEKCLSQVVLEMKKDKIEGK